MRETPKSACTQCWEEAYRLAIEDAAEAVEKIFHTAQGRGAARVIRRLLEPERHPTMLDLDELLKED